MYSMNITHLSQVEGFYRRFGGSERLFPQYSSVNPSRIILPSDVQVLQCEETENGEWIPVKEDVSEKLD